MTQENCYHLEYGVCAYGLSSFRGRACPEGHCPHFVSEADYFTKSMNNTLKEEKTPEEVLLERERILKNLRPGKSRKQLKREEKLEREKSAPPGGGFSLGDDPAFQALRAKLSDSGRTGKK